jgi:hypothetical protein
LGTYLLAGFWPRARQVDVIAAIVASVALMTPVVLGVPFPIFPGLAFPWFVPLGTGVTVAVGVLISLIRQSDSPAVATGASA